jgi:hypothetical protein
MMKSVQFFSKKMNKTMKAQHCISVMRAERLKSSLYAPNKLYGRRTVSCSEIPHYAYT